jgi:predicted amidohydrolase
VRVAAVQAEAVPGDIAGNIEKAARLTREAHDAGARLVVFPEAFATGYDDEVFRAGLPGLADTAWLVPLQEAVDAIGTVVVLNTALDRGGSLGLTDIVLRAGEPPLAAYDKQHLHPPEREVFAPGLHGASITIDGVRFALSVCYDANFPEHAASAAANGASVYINSGAYFPGGADRRDLHLASRALDNGVYVVFSGLVGGPSDFIGGSAVFDPLGRRIASVATFEGMAIADIDPDLIADTRNQQRMWAHRRASLGSQVRHVLDGAE